MYPAADARQIDILLRTSRGLDILGDVTVNVDQPADLVVWAQLLSEPRLVAWRSSASGKRFVHIVAPHSRRPIHGQVTIALACETHQEFWNHLLDRSDLEPGDTRELRVVDLVDAWTAMPLEPPS